MKYLVFKYIKVVAGLVLTAMFFSACAYSRKCQVRPMENTQAPIISPTTQV